MICINLMFLLSIVKYINEIAFKNKGHSSPRRDEPQGFSRSANGRDKILINLVMVLDAILMGRQCHQKLTCL